MIISLLTQYERIVDEEYIGALREFGEVRIIPKSAEHEAVAARLAESDVAVTGWESAKVPEPQPGWKLKYICHMTGEMKRTIPLACFDVGIKITNWGDSFSFATAEGSVALLLGVMKDLVSLDRKVRAEGQAGSLPRPFCTLYNTRVGIYGLSTIGRLVAEYLKPFRPKLSFFDPTVAQAPEGLLQHSSLRDLFAGSDVVTIHAGLNDMTRGTVDYGLLSLLPYGGALINTARGPIVVESDLARILKEGNIRAGIDVIDHEDDWRKSPLASSPNVIFTGHNISKIGPWEKLTLQQTALENIRRFVSGTPLKHTVTVERYKMMT